MTQEKREKLVKLRELLERHFDDEELRTVCFDLGVAYDDLPGTGKSAKARELVSRLDRHLAILELIEWVKENRPELSRYFEELEDNTIEFVNRGTELDQVFLSTLPVQYWVIDAPAGYGKTDFLRELKRRYDKLNWVTGYAAVTRDASPSIETLIKYLFAAVKAPGQYNAQHDVRTMGLQFAASLLPDNATRGANFGGAAILIDNIETLSPSTLEKLVDFIIGVYDGLSRPGFFRRQNQMRFFLAGRDARRKVASINALPFTELALSPYTFLYVKETVWRYALKVDAPLLESDIADIAACLMYWSGGHPGCIAEMLSELAKSKFTTVSLILQPKPQELLDRVVSTLENLFVEYEPDILDLIPIIEMLSVFRRFRTWLFQELMKKGHIKWEGDRYELEQVLLSTYLLRRERSFLQDSITQRLFAIRLRLNKPQIFEQLYRDGIEIYREKLSSSRNPEQLAVEYVYLRLQHAYYVEKACGALLKEKLKNILQETAAILAQGWKDDRNIVRDFISLLEEDWELEFFTNYFLGVESFRGSCSYDHSLYKQMVAEI